MLMQSNSAPILNDLISLTPNSSTSHRLPLFRDADAIVVVNMIYDYHGTRPRHKLIIHRCTLMKILSSYGGSNGHHGQISWSTWGPPCARWLDEPNDSSLIELGQQRLTLYRHPNFSPPSIQVYDFSPSRVRLSDEA